MLESRKPPTLKDHEWPQRISQISGITRHSNFNMLTNQPGVGNKTNCRDGWQRLGIPNMQIMIQGDSPIKELNLQGLSRDLSSGRRTVVVRPCKKCDWNTHQTFEAFQKSCDVLRIMESGVAFGNETPNLESNLLHRDPSHHHEGNQVVHHGSQ